MLLFNLTYFSLRKKRSDNVLQPTFVLKMYSLYCSHQYFLHSLRFPLIVDLLFKYLSITLICCNVLKMYVSPEMLHTKILHTYICVLLLVPHTRLR